MVRTRFALILYFRVVAHKAACHTLSKAFSKSMKTWLQILLMLEILFTQDSKAEDLFCGASSAIISSAWDVSLFKMTFSMTLLE